MKRLLLVSTLFLTAMVSAQDLDEQIKGALSSTVQDIKTFVAIPNNSINSVDIYRNISWLTNQFKQRGFNTTTLSTSGEPLFFGSLPMEDDRPTVLFYMHFDGQPVDASKWSQEDPYGVVLKEQKEGQWKTVPWENLKGDIDMEWRIFGRSVSDDKGPIIMMLHALDLLKSNKQKIPYNVKVILDSEEERGSKPLPDAVKQYKDLLEADLMIITDGPVHPSGQPTLVYGCRGITTVNLTTYGPIKPQHSGHFGNYAPNPGMQLAQLLASMKDAQGRVTIKGYYDGIELNDDIKTILAAVPDDKGQLLARLAIKTPEKVGDNYQESLQFPSLNVRGLSSGWVGAQARTIVPDKATAAIDMRLVPESDGDRLKKLVKAHIESQGFYVTQKEPSLEERITYDKIVTFEEGSFTKAFRTDMNHRHAQWLTKVMNANFDEELVHIRIMGGTVPIAPFINALNVPAIIVPMVNPDNNQHSPDENLRIANVKYGLKAFYGILSTPIE
ncbi:M20/M25/M40 family metallo-hydrolase [Sungkyunkwania multivorans]|uniref:M20/M25/M40 family metallo-hydrolase n=1 Tax=Sungkyunkwania multivorans TaxID=1173618 RepID=A0ABW3CXS5_9FLAO